MSNYAGAGQAVGGAIGSAFGPLGSAIGGSLGGLLGGALGGSDYEKPPGTLGTDQVLKLLKQGMTIEDIARIAPMSSRYMVRSQKKLMKAGLNQDQIQLLRAGPATSAGGSGPMSMGAFQGLLPAVFSNPSVFSSPEAANWLGSVFGVSPQTGQPVPVPAPMVPTAPMALGAPGGFTPWNTVGKGTPGPAPDPFTGLRSLAGPFGNGGGALLPNRTGKRSSKY